MTNAPVYYVVGLLMIFGFALAVYSDSNSAIYSWDHLIADEQRAPKIATTKSSTVIPQGAAIPS